MNCYLLGVHDVSCSEHLLHIPVPLTFPDTHPLRDAPKGLLALGHSRPKGDAPRNGSAPLRAIMSIRHACMYLGYASVDVCIYSCQVVLLSTQLQILPMRTNVSCIIEGNLTKVSTGTQRKPRAQTNRLVSDSQGCPRVEYRGTYACIATK